MAAASMPSADSFKGKIDFYHLYFYVQHGRKDHIHHSFAGKVFFPNPEW